MSERTPASEADEEAHFTTGTRLGRYEVLFPLASGGMGTVYAGRLIGAHGFDRLVAIKAMRRNVADRSHVEAFFDEARLTARISHPNVVETHELGEHQGAPFIVMQLIQGTSLAKLLDKLSDDGELLPIELGMWITAQTALGLHSAHELTSTEGAALHVVHRDVSPHNILLSYDGRVYVADFGVAKLTANEGVTASGVIKGKFGYMSPEQAEAKDVDRRTDIFALGIVLHEALTGAKLFSTDTPAATVLRVVRDEAPDVRDARAEVPDDVAAIAARCLEKDPDKRFDTAAEVAEALRRVGRAHGLVGDEQELSRILSKAFSGDRDGLRERIRGASSPSHERPSIPDDERTLSDTAEVESTEAAAILPAPEKRTSSRLALAAVLAGVTAVILVVALRPPAPSSDKDEVRDDPVAQSASHSADGVEPASTTAAAPTQAPPRDGPDAGMAGETSSAPSASPAVAPGPSPIRPKAPAAPVRSLQPPASPSPKKPSSDTAGKPFTDLGL